MLRRSSRLTNAGYYNFQGEPVISYRETSVYRRRTKAAPDSPRDTTKKTIRFVPGAKEASGVSRANKASGTNKASVANKASGTNKASVANKASGVDGATGPSWNSIICWLFYNNASGASGANGATGAIGASWNSIIRWLFYMLPVCFGIVSFSLALCMNGTSLDSGPSALPVPPTKLNTIVLSRTEELEQQVRMLRDELLKLKRIKELPPGGTMPNVALESQGARVLTQLSSRTYQRTKQSLSIRILKFLIPFWKPPADPSIVIQGGPIEVGRCWPFHGERGHLVIALSKKVTISHVTLGHISKTVSPTGNISSAPKMFAVYGMKTKEDEGTLLGTFLFDRDGESVQTFKLPGQEEGVFSHVKLQVQSNWGNPDYTCVYNFKVHGTI